MSDIELDDKFLEELINHNQRCTSNGSIKRVSRENWGHGVKETWHCNFCKETVIRHPFVDLKMPSGQNMPADNFMVPLSALDVGLSPSKLEGFLAGIGCCNSRRSNMQHHFDRVKEIAWPICKQQLMENRKAHVRACRRQKNYMGDLVFKDRREVPQC